MSLILDTSILIDIEKGDNYTIRKLSELSKIYNAPVQITFITYYEFLMGLKIGKPNKYNELLNFINSFGVLKITKKTADILSDLKIKYDLKGISLSLADLLIASQVIENKQIMLTKDKDFERIEELNKIFI